MQNLEATHNVIRSPSVNLSIATLFEVVSSFVATLCQGHEVRKQNMAFPP